MSKIQESTSSNVPSEREVLKKITDEFNSRLRPIIQGDNENHNPLFLGMPSQSLRACNIPELPIQMSVQRLIDKKLQFNHPFNLLSVVHMPDYVAKPIAIFQSKTRSDCKVLLTEMEDKGVNILVVIELNKLCGKIQANSVRSVYPKDNSVDILRWISEENLLEYCDKEKVLKWLGKQQSNSADVTRLLEDSTKIVSSL